MCISFPGQVVGVDASSAVVAADGRHRRASTLLFPDVAVGEWVSVAAGTIVDRLSVSEAADLQQLLDRGRDREPEPSSMPDGGSLPLPTSTIDPIEGEHRDRPH